MGLTVFRGQLLAGMALLVMMVNSSFANPRHNPLSVVPLPGNAEGQWIAKSVIINGLPMSIRAFVYAGPERRLIKFYQDFCRQQGARHIANDGSSVARTIGCQFKSGEYLSVNIEPVKKDIKIGRNRATFEGKITLSAKPPEGAKADTLTRIPMLIGSQVVSKMESIDAGRVVETVVYENSNSVRANVKYIRSKLTQSGWTPEYSDTSASNVKSSQLVFEKTGQLLQVTVKPGSLGGKTSVLVHWLK